MLGSDCYKALTMKLGRQFHPLTEELCRQGLNVAAAAAAGGGCGGVAGAVAVPGAAIAAAAVARSRSQLAST